MRCSRSREDVSVDVSHFYEFAEGRSSTNSDGLNHHPFSAHGRFLSMVKKLKTFCSRWLATFVEIHLEKEYITQVIRVICDTIREETDYLEREIASVKRHEGAGHCFSPPRDKRSGNSAKQTSTEISNSIDDGNGFSSFLLSHHSTLDSHHSTLSSQDHNISTSR